MERERGLAQRAEDESAGPATRREGSVRGTTPQSKARTMLATSRTEDSRRLLAGAAACIAGRSVAATDAPCTRHGDVTRWE